MDGAAGCIRIRGAREHNLKDVTVELPTGRITVVVGLSGSGKSSLILDTLAVEAQRQLAATFPWSVRTQLPRYERPQVDAVEHLSAPVVVDQRPLTGNARSTVGTITDVAPMLRAVFARYGDGALGSPSLYSFNDPDGMCPACDGLGRALRVDPGRLLDFSRSLDEGAIQVPGYPPGSPGWQMYAKDGRLDPARKLADYSAEELAVLLHGTGGTVELAFANGKTQRLRYEGLADNFTRRHLKRDVGTMSAKSRELAKRFLSEGTCPACDGDRLNPAALATTIDGRSIADWSRLQVADLAGLLAGGAGQVPGAALAALVAALERIAAIGLGYLSLDRVTSTLSGGEAQRLKLVRHLGSDLTGLTYIFDEPSAGLHPHDIGRLNDLLRALRDKGNTVVVVEHDPDVLAVADHVVELGPGAGAAGGQVVFEGGLASLAAAGTVTAVTMGRPPGAGREPRTPTGALALDHVRLHNLDDVSVSVPTGVLTAVTGVAGSGKSSLVLGALKAAHPGAVVVDQAPIAASSRSTPATWVGLMDPLRKLFAKVNGVDPGLFSFNSAGACERCQGRGVLVTELAFMDPITTHCDVCDGRRFKDEVLAYTVRGRSVADVLALSAEEAAGFLTEPALRARLGALLEVGLGYLGLGQSLSTLSGGERQRIKLAERLGASGELYLLDEPTTGLHLADIDQLVGLLHAMVERGNTVVVIEHELAVIAQADHVIDLGPGGGREGGRIVATGTPAELAKVEGSRTGEHLRRYLSA